jgi:aspartate/methionine/tyrosine aminotransferase
MVVPDHLVHAVNSLQQNMFINAPTISQVAALSCWNDDTQLELERHVVKYATNRSYILQQLDHLTLQGCTIAPSNGSFYIYVDLGDNVVLPMLDSVVMCEALLEECHVAFTPGIDFEDPATQLGQVRFRISYSQGTHIIQDAMTRFCTTFWPTWVARVQAAKQQQQTEDRESNNNNNNN